MKQIFSPIRNFYKNLSYWGRALIFIVLVLIIAALFKKKREGFHQNDNFVFKTGTDVYDEFYSSIYDQLVFSNIKDNYEIGKIIEKTHPTSESIILDVGCGTGHHVAALEAQHIPAIGIDISSAMIKQAKELYPNYNFVQGDVLRAMEFKANSFTHILCLYFTLYYFEDKLAFLRNCMYWLMPGGCLVIHIVNKDMFDPIIPPANPLVILSPQRYANKRITQSNVTFDNFIYKSNFDLPEGSDKAKFVEKFSHRETGKPFRRNEHVLYMESEDTILTLAREVGFIMQGEIDMIKSGYEYQKLFILVKPN
jgi:ubiquinone/menaquinone biosynthesis C-methylase UbiE